MSENQYDGGDDEVAAADGGAEAGAGDADAADKQSITDSEAIRRASERQKRMAIIQKQRE